MSDTNEIHSLKPHMYIHSKVVDWTVQSALACKRDVVHSSLPQKALREGIPDPYLEPLTHTWSHFVGIDRQKLTKSFKNDF